MKFIEDKPAHLLQVDTNYKTRKGRAKGWMTGILYLAPFKTFGMNVCPAAELAECHEPCLNKAGRGQMTCVQASRVRKTWLFHNEREWFMAQLYRDIEALERKAAREGFRPAVRLNGTSDLDWEVTKFGRYTLMECFPLVKFYDYTKVPHLPKHSNYHLTFSYSTAEAFQPLVKKAVKFKMNLAAVFRGPIPREFLGRPVIDGDADDLRFLDPEGVVVGLSAKGPAKWLPSPLVIDTNVIARCA